jgi:hypothetical protein
MPTYQQNKAHIYKYRETHEDHYRMYSREYAKMYNDLNKETLNKKALGRYYYKKEAEIFRNILL